MQLTLSYYVLEEVGVRNQDDSVGYQPRLVSSELKTMILRLVFQCLPK